ncbi:T9SS type B sorting domain-containing protein [Flagellimonas sp.]|uniref:T9SS type B sorting domain-containing protein n=1 Tax=Flagellimonas sp. TaxID=2058762 RepID=UPI003B5B23B7
MFKNIAYLLLPMYLVFNTIENSTGYVRKMVPGETTVQTCDHFINTPPDFYACDTDNNSIEQFSIDLVALERQVMGSQTGLTISYHSPMGVVLDMTDPGNQLAVNQRTIWVRLTNAEGCYKETTFDLILESPIKANKLENVEECESFTLPPLNTNNQYYTQINAGGTMLNPGDIINKSQTIYIYASSNSCSDQSKFLVTIDPKICDEPTEVCKIEFPKFITPNNDDINDSFKPLKNDCGTNGILYIYDRYGNLLRQFAANDGEWKGDFKGTALPASDYWYRFVSEQGDKEFSGHFALKR